MSVANNSMFYLKNVEHGQYLTAADNGRYSWPQLGWDNDKVALKLIRQSGTKGETWKIMSTESSLGSKNILGAFTDSRDCYYWKDNYDRDKQGWEITPSSAGSDFSLGDEVHILNVSYQQYLVADFKNEGYITTDKNKKERWALVPVAVANKEPAAPQKPAAAGSEDNAISSNQTEQVFQLSVASGDPTENSVILWTRLNDNRGTLSYEISESEDFQTKLNGTPKTIDSAEFGEDRDYTVNIDVTGLDANKTYFYRFEYNGVYSQTGRCRTLPAANAEVSNLRLAVITCNDYSSGYFNAFYKLADANVDFVVHLGDFVYEYSQYPDGYGTRHRDEISLEDDTFKISREAKDYEGCDRAYALKDFRKIYRTYREDKALQSAMEKHTWIIMLDDHELADDFYWNYERKTAGANPSHSIYKQLGEKTEAADKAMLNLCQNGKQAWREYVPYRPIPDDKFPADHPNHYQLYRKFKFGNLVEFFLTDSRSYRDKPERKENVEIQDVLHEAVEDGLEKSFSALLKEERDKRNLEPWQYSMLGPDQKKWLLDGVTTTDAKWKVWGNQTLMASAGLNVLTRKYDDWLGFITERYEILYAIKESENKSPGGDQSSHFVVFTGDMHTSLIAYLKTDFEGFTNTFNQDYSRLAGVEFMTPAVTSPGLHEFASTAVSTLTEGEVVDTVTGVAGKITDWLKSKGGAQLANPLSGVDAMAQLMKAGNPHIKDVNSGVNGFAIATFTSHDMTWEVYSVDKSAYETDDEDRRISTRGVETKRVRSVRYDPSQIALTDWKDK